MQSWGLKKFVDKYGAFSAAAIWGKSRQAVEQAIESKRQIKIVQIDGHYEVHEHKLLNKVAVHLVNIDSSRFN